ncbi:protein of unknown function [Cupriavidus taiwanensis]|uniref:Uncharacterized protein n=1 Tax=Cupriavidus taiwanensis TaxID=164546 RepID=A0A9Q7UTM0_9BURK|nr:protein of unknown function [Cupriavidus taiwanensis]
MVSALRGCFFAERTRQFPLESGACLEFPASTVQHGAVGRCSARDARRTRRSTCAVRRVGARVPRPVTASRATKREGAGLARRAADPFGLALSLSFAAELRQRGGDVQCVRECAEAASAPSQGTGFRP